MPEVPVRFDLSSTSKSEIAVSKLRIPVNETLVLVDQPGAMELDKHLAHGFRQTLVHRKAQARPIAGAAQPFELTDNRVAGLVLPLPDPFYEILRVPECPAVRLMPFTIS